MSTVRTCLAAVAVAGIALCDAGLALAANIPKIKNVRVRDTDGAGNTSLTVVVDNDPTNEVAAVEAKVDGGAAATCKPGTLQRQAIVKMGRTRLQPGAWVHVAVVRGNGKVLARFQGQVDASGHLSLAPDKSNVADVQLVRKEVSIETIEIAHEGIELGLTVQGGDVVFANAATVRMTETSFGVDGGCSSKLGCGDGLSGTDTTVAPFAGVERLWSCGLDAAMSGVAKVKAKAWGLDQDGAPLLFDSAHALATTAWDDGGAGVQALPIVGDPFTTAALIMDQLHNGGTGFRVAVVSDGWDAAGALPTHAEVTLDGGAATVVPAGSYQVTGASPLAFKGSSFDFEVSINGQPAGKFVRFGDGWARCSLLHCLRVRPQGGAWTLSATAWAPVAAKLPPMVVVAFPSSPADKGALPPPPVKVVFDPQVAVVFAQPVAFQASPFGADVTGSIRLFGAADAKGKVAVLAKGGFEGVLTTDDDDGLGLGARDLTGSAASDGVLLALDPAKLDPKAPPPAFVASNGYGTRSVATTTNGKPGLL